MPAHKTIRVEGRVAGRAAIGLALAPLLGVIVLGAGACEDPRSGAAPEATSHAERDAARALLAQLVAIASPPERADTLARAVDAGALMALVAPPGVPFSPPSAAGAGALADCLLATGSAATLSECELGDHVIDGTWSLQYPAAHTELVDVFVVGPRDHGSLWIDARLAVTERIMDALPEMPAVRSIDGDIEISLMWAADNREYALDASIHIDGLAIDPAGDPALEHDGELARPVCAIGGAVTIRAAMSTDEQSRVTMWFGPGCRDVHVARGAGP